MTRLTLLTVVFLALPIVSSEARADQDGIVVVVDRENPAAALTRDQLRQMFQTVRSEWSDGTKVVPVNLPEDDALRKRFDTAVLGLDPDRVERYWIDRKVRGGARPPRKVTSEAAVLRLVATSRGGVGYVKASTVDKTVKIIARINGGQVVAP